MSSKRIFDVRVDRENVIISMMQGSCNVYELGRGIRRALLIEFGFFAEKSLIYVYFERRL